MTGKILGCKNWPLNDISCMHAALVHYENFSALLHCLKNDPLKVAFELAFSQAPCSTIPINSLLSESVTCVDYSISFCLKAGFHLGKLSSGQEWTGKFPLC